MSVKFGLLALLSRGDATTYQLRRDFDESTSQTWPLNIGQVSSTMQRLQRDGLVERDAADDDAPSAGEWRLTDAGRKALDGWWASPVAHEERGRDELIVKLALAVAVPGVDVAALVQSQRIATQRLLHDLSRLRRETDASELPARLVLDNHLFTAEAELRWLDTVEAELERWQRLPASQRAGTANPPGPSRAKQTRNRAVNR